MTGVQTCALPILTSIGDTKEGMDRLLSALFEIDEELEKKSLRKEFQFLR